MQVIYEILMKYYQGKIAKSYNVSINQMIPCTIKWMSCVSKSMTIMLVICQLYKSQVI